MFEKTMTFAGNGKGRRLYNALSSKEMALSRKELSQVLSAYRCHGLALEVEHLKKRRGILTDAQYDALAQEVAQSCRPESLDAFLSCLKELLSCGIKMNPTKMEVDSPE